jgi:protein-L-isoaspartate(D-aspartate) O-methyltransferase
VADGRERLPVDDPFAQARARLVAEQILARGIRDPAVLEAMGRVPREAFVPVDLRHRAYEDGALGIGHGQTISQPFIVARMSEALDLTGWHARHPGESPAVLDVGTGSGYQAAILAAMGAEVTSIEWNASLSRAAAERLAGLGYRVETVVGDGGLGYPARAPYAGIVLAAAAPALPPPLAEQVAGDGSVVAPIGRREHQQLTVYRRRAGRLEQVELEPCVVVPLLGRYGYR